MEIVILLVQFVLLRNIHFSMQFPLKLFNMAFDWLVPVTVSKSTHRQHNLCN